MSVIKWVYDMNMKNRYNIFSAKIKKVRPYIKHTLVIALNYQLFHLNVQFYQSYCHWLLVEFTRNGLRHRWGNQEIGKDGGLGRRTAI